MEDDSDSNRSDIVAAVTPADDDRGEKTKEGEVGRSRGTWICEERDVGLGEAIHLPPSTNPPAFRPTQLQRPTP